jgi:hypothetical protein
MSPWRKKVSSDSGDEAGYRATKARAPGQHGGCRVAGGARAIDTIRFVLELGGRRLISPQLRVTDETEPKHGVAGSGWVGEAGALAHHGGDAIDVLTDHGSSRASPGPHGGLTANNSILISGEQWFGWPGSCTPI